MSILIKGMEMPENCDRCKLVRYFGMAGGIECLAKKKWPATSYANEDFRESGTRPDWCPLVEVPDEQPDRNAQERYEDLCEYFKDCHDKGMGILGDRKEFKAWLERVYWHVVRCDELGRELEKLQSAQPKIEERMSETEQNVPNDDFISRKRAIDAVIKRDANCGIDSAEVLKTLPSAQPTLCGYDIDHLMLIAVVLRKENLPPERVTEALTDIGRIISIVRNEFEESLRKAVEQCKDGGVSRNDA